MNTKIASFAVKVLSAAAASLLRQAQEISDIIAKANAEGRDVSEEDMKLVIAQDDAAKVAVNEAIMRYGA